jgi:hypothetical protein
MLVGYAFCAFVGIFSFLLLLLNVNILFVHFSYVVVLLALPSCVVVGASCGLMLLFLSHYFFHTTSFLALFLYTIACHTSIPLSATPHVVDPLELPLFSCCYCFHTILFALLLLSRCYF